MEALVITAALAVLLNFAILKYKIHKKKYDDVFADVGAVVFLAWLFAGSMVGAAISMIGGALVSIWLLFFPLGKKQ